MADLKNIVDIPAPYEPVYEKMVNVLANETNSFLIDDDKNFRFRCFELFQFACSCYNVNRKDKGDIVVNYIVSKLGLDVDYINTNEDSPSTGQDVYNFIINVNDYGWTGDPIIFDGNPNEITDYVDFNIEESDKLYNKFNGDQYTVWYVREAILNDNGVAKPIKEVKQSEYGMHDLGYTQPAYGMTFAKVLDFDENAQKSYSEFHLIIKDSTGKIVAESNTLTFGFPNQQPL